jgi:choloylglycine hydrolase
MKVMYKSTCIVILLLVLKQFTAYPCKGITLKSTDGGVVAARTVEWALGDAQHNKILVVPSQKAFIGQTPKGYTGKKWTGKYGFVTLTAYDQAYGPEKNLVVLPCPFILK